MEPDPAQVYSPAEDTALLCMTALRELRAGDRVLEIGTGSGAVAAAIVDKVRCLIASDINPHAVALVSRLGIPVIRADLTAGIRGPFDLILFNPPYLPTSPEERIDDWLEYALDGGKTGRATLERFAADVKRVLAPGGRILVLISSLTGPDAVKELFATHGLHAELIREERVEDETLLVLRFTR